MLASLQGALAELTTRLGPDMNGWAWGRLHHAAWSPAIAVLADPTLKAAMSVGPEPIPGGASSPRAGAYAPATFDVNHGASVRMVIDVGAWDNSMVVDTPGQSGDPASPHYRDLFPLWAAGTYVPLLYSRKAVEAQAERVISVRPGA